MLSEDQAERLPMADIIGHPWLSSGPIASVEEVEQEMLNRRAALMLEAEERLIRDL